ncbi:MAG: energy-coupling factor transporter ATPase [Defluviitaleaceae bacterium]|nr:energy-coupling factor transporter ATPase [Defluviitaleaceae bacterium]
MISGENLTFIYEEYDSSKPPLVALKNIDVNIQAGEFVAVLGHNGSGKSTLARHLNALLAPTEGTLWVHGLDTKDPANTWQIRQSTGMVFQNPDNQIIATIVEEDVAFGPENLGVAPEEIRRRVTDTLASVNMSDYATFAPHHLSGGQKQRVAIAGVLAMHPSVIVLDEPSAMLDPSGRKEVMDTIIHLNKKYAITVILITHFMEEAARAERVIVMDDGSIVLDAPPREIFSQIEKMQSLGLGVPQITELSHLLGRKHVITVEEFLDNFDPSEIKHYIYEETHTKIQTNPSPPLLELVNVSHIYNSKSVFEKTAIHDINLKIYDGEIIAIIGHTGSGKSTLIQHFNALIKPTEGEVLIEGKNVSDSIKDLRRRVGLVFQYPEHQLFEVTVYKDVAFGPARLGLSEEEIEKNVKSALDTVGLGEEFYEKSPFELSGGEKRRAAIAGVLAMRPDVLILDEPAAGLDPRGKNEIFEQIKKMHQALGITIILVSHSMDDAARMANRVLVMNQGKIVRDDTPAEIFSDALFLTDIGLDTPQITQLMASLHEKNPNIPKRVFSVQEAVTILERGFNS